MPFLIGIHLERKLSKSSLVLWLERTWWVKSMRVGGILCFHMLCRRQSVTALGKTPLMSRNRVGTTFPALQVFLMVASNRWRESVVDHPGQPLKWVLESRLWVLMR